MKWDGYPSRNNSANSAGARRIALTPAANDVKTMYIVDTQ